MLIKVTVGHCLGGGRDVEPGAVLELEDREAQRKIRKGYAVAATKDDQAAFQKAQKDRAAAEAKARKEAEEKAAAEAKAAEEAAKKASGGS